MKYVVDSCVALKWVFPEQDSDRAIAVRDGGHTLLAPDIFPIEVGHVLSKAFRRRMLAENDANEALRDILDVRPALYNSRMLLWRAFDISRHTRCTLYDALYVALAEREGCQFVTADEKLVRNLQVQFTFVVALSTV